MSVGQLEDIVVGLHCLDSVMTPAHMARLSINELCRLTCLIFLQLFWIQASQKRFILHHPSQRGMNIIKMKTCLKRSVRSYDSFPTIPSSTVHWIWLHLRMSVHLGPIHRSHTASEQDNSWENWALNCWFMNLATTSHYQPELRCFCGVFHSRSITQPYGIRTFEIANNH